VSNWKKTARNTLEGGSKFDPLTVTTDSQPSPKKTPLYDLHELWEGKLVPFTGYLLPIQYASGIIAEHKHTRTKASLFDVSHMGQVKLSGSSDICGLLEKLVPADLSELAPYQMTYTFFSTRNGGVLDDLLVTRLEDSLLLVVNGARKEEDLKHLHKHIGSDCKIEYLESKALLALQGPKAVDVLSQYVPALHDLRFMHVLETKIVGIPCLISRSGYTGEDGFEISLPENQSQKLALKLMENPVVQPAGLGARDSLRLEAGLCLYGQDLTESTSPIAARLGWTIGKRRRQQGGFLGDKIILPQLDSKPDQIRVGLLINSKIPAREGAEIQSKKGITIGSITSGGYSPCLETPIAMGYVASDYSEPGTPLKVIVRNKELDAKVVKLPFVKQNYFRGQ
jgi:aminomethyltransferase